MLVATHDARGDGLAAYLVLMQEIVDVERYRSEYLPGVMPFVQKYGAEMLVAGSDAQAAEGEPAQQHGRDPLCRHRGSLGFLNDPGYQPVKEVRLSATSRTQMVVAP